MCSVRLRHQGTGRYRSGRSPNGKNFPLLVGQVPAENKVLSIVIEPFLILASKPLYESEVGFLVLAFVFQLRFRFRIDKSLHSCLVCKFLNDVRQGLVAP